MPVEIDKWGIGTNPAIPLVLEGVDFIKSEASDLMYQAQNAIYQIGSSLFDVETPVISFDAPAIESGTFVRPTAPVAPEVTAIDTTLPTAPSLAGVTLDDLPAAPTEPDFGDMVYVKPGAPTAAMPTEPADTDVPLVEIDIPDAPVYEMPDDPVLYELTLPEIADLTIPTFDGVRPTFDLEAPAHTFSWQYEVYDETFIDSLKSKLSAMTINGLALPADIEQAIFDRLRSRSDTLTLQQIQQAEGAMSGRGLRNPGGFLHKIIDRLGAEQRRAGNTASVDVGIEVARQNIEAVKFAIAQGIALESAMLQSHIAVQSLTLDAAKATQAAFIQVFEAQVSLHNAQWEGFKAEAQVFESRIRALNAQAEVIKTRIEAEKVKGDVNEGLVRAYGEKIRALSAMADIYRAQVEGAKAKGEINVQRLEQARLRIQTFGVKVDAWGKGWDGYKAQVEAETAGLRYWETQGNIYANRVQAWKGQVEAQDTRARTLLASQGQELDVFRATLAGVATRIQGDTASAEVRARLYQSQVAGFAAEGQMSSAEVNAINDSQRLVLDGSRLVYDSAKSNAEIAANVGLKRIEYAMDANRGAAQIWAQLAASVFSGLNFSGSVGYSSGASVVTTFQDS